MGRGSWITWFHFFSWFEACSSLWTVWTIHGSFGVSRYFIQLSRCLGIAVHQFSISMFPCKRLDEKISKDIVMLLSLVINTHGMSCMTKSEFVLVGSSFWLDSSSDYLLVFDVPRMLLTGSSKDCWCFEGKPYNYYHWFGENGSHLKIFTVILYFWLIQFLVITWWNLRL